MFFTNRRKKVPGSQTKQSRQNSIKKSIPFYIMFIPVLIYFVVFRYVPLLLSLVISVENISLQRVSFRVNGWDWNIINSL